jgi:hypothetical protein
MTKTTPAPDGADAPRKRGRPRIERDQPLALMQTRVPEAMRDYLKAVAAYRYKTLMNMHDVLFRQFMQERPFEKGLHFRKPRTADGTTGWCQMNLLLPEDLVELLKAEAETLGISLATYLFTALYWWATYMHPPATAQGGR